MQNQQYRWFEMEPERAAHTVFHLVRHWDQTQGGIQASNIRHMKLYSNRDVNSLSIAQYVMNATQDPVATGYGGGSWNRPNRISLNIIKNCIDTLYSKIAKNKIKPTFLTTGGTLKAKRRSRDLNKYMFGMLWDTNAYNIVPMAFKDALIFGTGFIKILRDSKNRIKLERIFPDEITLDPADGYYGNPQNLFQRKFVSRDVLIDRFPEHEEKIREVKQVDISYTGAAQDTILVVEGWHLGSNAKHIICIENCALFIEDYEKDYIPIAKIQYTEQSIGFFGMGICEELIGIQVEINRLLLHVQESLRLMAYPRIFVESGSKVNPRHFTNEIGTFIPYTGTPPIIQLAQAINPEVFQQIESLYQKAFQIAGISALSAQSQKPAGLNSGRALREFNDIETERFARTAQQFEQVFIDITHMVCDELDATPDYIICSPEKSYGLKQLKWKDIRVPRNELMVQTFPTSALPQTPALRLQWVQDMQETGLIDMDMALDLLDFPDLDMYNQLSLAPLRLAVKVVEDIIYDHKYTMPEPFWNLNLCIKLAQQYYNLEGQDDVHERDDKARDLLRQFMDDCDGLIAQAQMKANAALPPTLEEVGLPPQLQIPQQQQAQVA